MHRTHHEKARHVGEQIRLSLMCSATVVGRTYEEEPRVDIRTPWGILTGIPQSVLGTMELSLEPMPDNVERIRLSRSAAGEAKPRLPLISKG